MRFRSILEQLNDWQALALSPGLQLNLVIEQPILGARMDVELLVLIGTFLVVFCIAGWFSSITEQTTDIHIPDLSNSRLRSSNFWLPIEFVPERCDKEYEIRSLAFPPNNRVYRTNPYRFECDCGWVSEDVLKHLEENVPANDIRRFCRHMVSACWQAKVFSREVEKKELSLELRTFLGEAHRHHRMRICEVEGRRAIIGYNENDSWVNIFFETPKKTKFTKHGFNIYENRWSYSSPPRGLSKVFRQIISEEIFENDLR